MKPGYFFPKTNMHRHSRIGERFSGVRNILIVYAKVSWKERNGSTVFIIGSTGLQANDDFGYAAKIIGGTKGWVMVGPNYGQRRSQWVNKLYNSRKTLLWVSLSFCSRYQRLCSYAIFYSSHLEESWVERLRVVMNFGNACLQFILTFLPILVSPTDRKIWIATDTWNGLSKNNLRAKYGIL